MEETISLQEVLQALKKRIGLIFSIILLSVIVGATITFFVLTPRYEASTQILVNQAQTENEELSSTDLQSSRELISTYNVIMTSPAILEPVINESGFEGSVNDLRSQISVSAEEESQVVTVTIDETDPQEAVDLVNTLAQTFEQEISNIMDVDNVSILSEAQVTDSESPVSPQPSINLALAIVIGIVIGTSIAFLLEFLDKSMKSEHDIEKKLGLPVLGTIPVMQESEFKNPSDNDKKSNLRSNNQKIDRKTS